MKVLNRDVIKWIAIALMFMDHAIKLFMERGTMQYNILDALSHFTFVTMSFFLVEGYYYTKSKRAYLKRIFLFAMISQVPYALVLAKGIIPLNILFILSFCFLMIYGIERVQSKLLKAFIVVISLVICSFCDWMFFAPIITLLFYWARGNVKRLAAAYVIDAVLFGLFNVSGYLVTGDLITGAVQFVVAISGIVLSGICILVFYNGKCIKGGKKFQKWFFYWFYPVHIIVLGVIEYFL